MPNFKANQSVVKFLQSPYFVAGILLFIFHIVTGYKYGWDDQHLEIPLLKHLINPELYNGDYYIEALQENFFSYFFIILSKLIRVDQIPFVYALLFAISRYFLFFFTYKLWLVITKNDKLISFACVCAFIYFIRVSEFLYSTFSHQEFALAAIVGGIYFFFKERFTMAAVFLGLATNFHALYSVFPMFFMSIYLLTEVKKRGFIRCARYVLTYILCALPFVVWSVRNRFLSEDTADYTNWIAMYITACPQNFFYPKAPFITFSQMLSNPKIFYVLNQPYIFIVLLFTLNLIFNKDFRQNKKAICYCVGAFVLLIISFVFTYVKPSRFVLDLNLIRNTQFLSYLLVGYTTVFAFKKTKEKGVLFALLITLLFSLLKLSGNFAVGALLLLIIILTLAGPVARINNQTVRILLSGIGYALIMPTIFWIYQTFTIAKFKPPLLMSLYVLLFAVILLTIINSKFYTSKNLRKLFILIPLFVFFGFHTYTQQTKNIVMKKSPQGFWAMQRSWEDMQRFVQAETPTESMLLVPYNMEMGGFRIQSERKIICSYRDCGIVGFDYNAALEWRQRVADILPFDIKMDKPTLPAIKNAITKYGATHIVTFNNRMANKPNALINLLYTNQFFALYEVMINPQDG